MIRPFAACKIGNTVIKNYLANVASTATPVLRSQDFPPATPLEVMLFSTQDCWVRIGDSSVAAPTAATDFFLAARTYMPLIVENANDAYFTVLSLSAGTLYVTDAVNVRT